MADDLQNLTTEEIAERLRNIEAAADVQRNEHTSPGRPGVPYWYQQTLDDMTSRERALTYIGQGMNKGYTHLMNYVPGMEREPIWGQDVTDKGLTERAEGPDAAIYAQPGAMVGTTAGEALAMTPTVMGATGALSRVPWLGRTLMGTPARRMITEGALQGNILAPPGHKTEGTAFGAGAGAAFPASKWAWTKLTQGVEPTDWARTAMGKGVDLSVRQMNPESTLGRIQGGWLNDLPFIGRRLRAGETAAYNQWKQNAIQDVTAPGATIPVKDNLTGMLDDAYKTFDSAYDGVRQYTQVYPYILNTNGPNVPLRTAVQKAVNASGTYDAAARKTVAKFANERVSELSTKNLGRQPGAGDFIEARSKVRAEIRRLRRTAHNNPVAGDKIDLLENVEEQFTKALESQLPDDAAQALKAADLQYAKYKVMEDAFWRANGRGEDVMPKHITAAVKNATDKGRFARGEGLMREYADQADEVFTPHDPTKGDQFAASTLPVAAAVLHPAGTAAAMAPLLGATMTRGGRKVMAGMTAPQRGLRTLGEKVMGLSNSELAQKYGEAPAVFARSGIRGAIEPNIRTSSQNAANRGLNIMDADIDKAGAATRYMLGLAE